MLPPTTHTYTHTHTLSMKALSACLLGQVGVGVGLWSDIHHPTPGAGVGKKANFPFYQPGLFVGF